MPKKGQRKCCSCGDFVEDFNTSLQGKPYCDPCKEAMEEYPSTCVEFPDCIVTRFTGYFGDFEDGELPEPVLSEQWHKTDAWRGYTDWTLKPGYEKISDGWVTGMPDESTRRKADLAEIYEQLKSGKLVPPVQMYWLFGITSNVFSTACTLVVKSTDKAALVEWLASVDCSVEALEDMLS